MSWRSVDDVDVGVDEEAADGQGVRSWAGARALRVAAGDDGDVAHAAASALPSTSLGALELVQMVDVRSEAGSDELRLFWII